MKEEKRWLVWSEAAAHTGTGTGTATGPYGMALACVARKRANHASRWPIKKKRKEKKRKKN
jgi:hypothetical protein